MSNIQETLKEFTKEIVKKGKELLLSGSLLDLELLLQEALQNLHKEIVTLLLQCITTSKEFLKELGKLRCALYLGKLKRRKIQLQIASGDYIEIVSYYATKGRNFSYKGERHMSLVYWGCIKKASPVYYSRVGLLSILCPSFDIGKQLLNHFGIQCEPLVLL